MMRNFNDWFDEVGHTYYEEIVDYLENCPNSIDLQEDIGIYDINEFAFIKCEDIYDGILGDYVDRCYDEYKERDI